MKYILILTLALVVLAGCGKGDGTDSCMDFNELGKSWNLMEGTYYISQLDDVACIDGKGLDKTFILYDSRVPRNRIMDKEMLERYLSEYPHEPIRTQR